jgi:integrase/recombinase XerD
MKDIHDYGKRLESAKRRLAQLENAEFHLSFIAHLEAIGQSTGRVAKYANHVCALTKRCPLKAASATSADVEKVIAWINTQPSKSSTKADLRRVVKKIVQYAKVGRCDKNAPIPPEAAWIVIGKGDKDSRVTPEALITPEELNAMINAAQNERDKALVTVIFEAALRPGELLTMIVGSVQFKEDYCIITVNGKTGIKRIPLVVSTKPLLDWLAKHPRNKDTEVPLWASLGNNSKGNCVSYYYMRKMLKALAKRANVKRNVWPYLFRHSCLTAMAKVFTESKLELYAGWVQGSKMTRRYVHFSARDLEEAVLELHGLTKTDEAKRVLKLEDCPRCGKKNQPNSVRCNFCGYILDRGLAEEMEQKTVERELEIQSRLQKLEQTVTSLLSSQAKT